MNERWSPRGHDPVAEDLARLRTGSPFTVDVAERVMARIADLPDPARREHRLAHVAAAAVVAAAAMLLVALGSAQRLAAIRSAAVETVLAVWDLVAATVRVAGPLLGIARKLGTASWTVADAVLQSLATATARPEAPLLASLCALAVVATAVYLVARDLRGPGPTKEHRS